MDHISDIGLVNSHAKGIGSHDHRCPVINKILLIFLSGFAVQARVVFRYRYSTGKKQFVKRIHIFPCGAVDNSAVLWMLFYVGNNKIGLAPDILYLIIQVLPVKPRYNHMGISKIQDTGNIIFYFFRGSSGKRT